MRSPLLWRIVAISGIRFCNERTSVYDPVLLRTFLAVAGSGSFTAAGVQLGLSQPTVSQHIRRLEEAVGRPLILRDTRDVRLTDAGDALTGFAHSILAAHATAERYFEAGATKARLRFGASDDLAITQLPRILRHFRSSNPQVSLELSVGQSEGLAKRLAAGQLDLVFVKQQAADGAGEGVLVLRDTFVWIADESAVVDRDAPVPLVAYRAPSPSRRMAIAALEAAGRKWRITCTVRDIGGLIAAPPPRPGGAGFPPPPVPPDPIKGGKPDEPPHPRHLGLPPASEPARP